MSEGVIKTVEDLLDALSLLPRDLDVLVDTDEGVFVITGVRAEPTCNEGEAVVRIALTDIADLGAS